MAFHLHRDGKAVEFALDELKAMARRGDLRQDEYVYDDVKGEWLGAALVPELQGAWDIEENEATVAMQLPPDFFEKFDEEDKAASESLEGPTTKQPEPEPAPAPTAPPPAALQPSTPPPAAEDDGDEATRAMDLAELEGALSPSSQQQSEATVAMDVSQMQASAAASAPEPRRPQPNRPDPTRPQPARPQPQRPASQRAVRPMGNRATGKTVNPVIAAILSFFTCGIYTLVWIWKRSEETNAFLGREELPRWVVPAIIAAVIFFGGGIGVITAGVGTALGWLPGAIIGAIWAYKLGECVGEMSQQSRLQLGDRKVVYALCALFAPILIFLAQQDLNEIWKANGARD